MLSCKKWSVPERGHNNRNDASDAQGPPVFFGVLQARFWPRGQHHDRMIVNLTSPLSRPGPGRARGRAPPVGQGHHAARQAHGPQHANANLKKLKIRARTFAGGAPP